jgi:hypothetical protein
MLNERKCPNCNKKFGEHSDEDVTACVQVYQSGYDGTRVGIFYVLGEAKLTKKYGQPSGDKKEWAFWPLDGGEPVASKQPERDFGIYFLAKQNKEEKKSFFGLGKSEEVDPVEEEELDEAELLEEHDDG